MNCWTQHCSEFTLADSNLAPGSHRTIHCKFPWSLYKSDHWITVCSTVLLAGQGMIQFNPPWVEKLLGSQWVPDQPQMVNCLASSIPRRTAASRQLWNHWAARRGNYQNLPAGSELAAELLVAAGCWWCNWLPPGGSHGATGWSHRGVSIARTSPVATGVAPGVAPAVAAGVAAGAVFALGVGISQLRPHREVSNQGNHRGNLWKSSDNLQYAGQVVFQQLRAQVRRWGRWQGWRRRGCRRRRWRLGGGLGGRDNTYRFWLLKNQVICWLNAINIGRLRIFKRLNKGCLDTKAFPSNDSGDWYQLRPTILINHIMLETQPPWMQPTMYRPTRNCSTINKG